MTNVATRRLRLIYGILTAAALCVAGLCLMYGCVMIYFSGSRPFTPEAVAFRFSQIAVPVYIALGLSLGGWILHLVLPAQKKTVTAIPCPRSTIRKLEDRFDLSSAAGQIGKLRKWRKVHWYVSAGLCFVFAVIFLGYGLNPENFHQSDINGSMIRAMAVLFPCLLIPFGYSLFTAYFSRRSLKKELALVKETIRKGCAKKEPAPKAESKSFNWLRIGRLALLAAALGLAVYGFIAGGTLDVLTKAINICTECVGLG